MGAQGSPISRHVDLFVEALCPCSLGSTSPHLGTPLCSFSPSKEERPAYGPARTWSPKSHRKASRPCCCCAQNSVQDAERSLWPLWTQKFSCLSSVEVGTPRKTSTVVSDQASEEGLSSLGGLTNLHRGTGWPWCWRRQRVRSWIWTEFSNSLKERQSLLGILNSGYRRQSWTTDCIWRWSWTRVKF